MALVRFKNALGEGVDMSDFEIFYGWTEAATPTTIRVTDGEYTTTYRGDFRYPNDTVTGTLETIRTYWFGTEIYSVTGLSMNANTYLRILDEGDSEVAFRYLASGHDTVVGTRYSDVLIGATGNDTIRGSAGNDRLYGEVGSDKLIGGAGRDQLYGGAGADDFIFMSPTESPRGSRRDQILDFSRGQRDQIDVSAIDANENRRGNQTFEYIGSSDWSEKAGELRFKDGLLAGDTDGDGRAEFAMLVSDMSWLRLSELIL